MQGLQQVVAGGGDEARLAEIGGLGFGAAGLQFGSAFDDALFERLLGLAKLPVTVAEGLGGTHQGIIGALAAVALAAGGDDGRVVHLQDWPWPDPFSGVQPVDAIRNRGVAEIWTLSGEAFTGEFVDVGKHLRPNWRDGCVVLFVEAATGNGAVARATKVL